MAKKTIFDLREMKKTAQEESMSRRPDLRKRLKIDKRSLSDINDFLLDPDSRMVNDLLDVVAKYGTPEEINRRAAEARQLPNLISRLTEMNSPRSREQLMFLRRLQENCKRRAFISLPEYRKRILGEKKAKNMILDGKFAVTLEVSALQYFEWLMTEVNRSIDRAELMPGRFIRVRRMKEQEADGDLPAIAAAMQIIGASYVETLDTKGTMPGPDGAPVNVHLGGSATITGYFGGVGQPNGYALAWLDEYLYYYANYGVRQVLNINPGTVMLGYLIHKLGVDIEFKISVFMGNDNPYAALWTLMGAKLLCRRDGSTPLVGFNWSNSANNETIEITAQPRRAFGFEDIVRFEHHITETYKSIVRQPYDRTAELAGLANRIANISAKHEGGKPAVEATREHPSDILDYFRERKEVEASGQMRLLEQNYLDKHEAVNHTADALTRAGIDIICARVHAHK